MVDTTTTTITTATASAVLDPQLSAESPITVPDFVPEQCLFCNRSFEGFAESEEHMRLVHGFSVPHKDRLLVDTETLFAFLHLVIVGYNECISCGSQRHNAEAVRQHMVGKGHCHFEIEDEESELRDFYDFEMATSSQGEDESGGSGSESKEDRPTSVRVDAGSLRLPSGRIISNKSSSSSTSRKTRQVSPPRTTSSHASISSNPSNANPTSRNALTRAEKAEVAFAKQLERLSPNDERSLSHLTLPQQRAVIMAGQKQVEKAQRKEQRMRGRLEGQGNVFLMEHFRKDAADKRTLFR